MIQKRPRLRGFCGFWTETETAFFRSPPPEKPNLLPVFWREPRSLSSGSDSRLGRFRLKRGASPGRSWHAAQAEFRQPHPQAQAWHNCPAASPFFYSAHESKSPCIPAVKPPPLTIGYSGRGQKEERLSRCEVPRETFMSIIPKAITASGSAYPPADGPNAAG